MTVSAAVLSPAASMSNMDKVRMCGNSIKYVTGQPFIFNFYFCSSWVKRKPAWLCPGELRFEAKKKLFSIDVDRTTKQSLQMEIFAHFLCLQASLLLQ